MGYLIKRALPGKEPRYLVYRTRFMFFRKLIARSTNEEDARFQIQNDVEMRNQGKHIASFDDSGNEHVM